MSEVLPFILNKPKVTIGGTADTGDPPAAPTGGTDLQCFGHKVSFKPTESSTDLEGFCFTATSFKPVKWELILSVFQSFGTGNLWDLLVPLEGQNVMMAVTPDADSPAATVDNPTAFALVRVPPIVFLDADVGQASDFDLSFAVQGTLAYDPVPGA